MLREMTEREARLFGVIGDEWLSRQEIAHLLRVPRLSPTDLEALAVLDYAQVLESWKKPDNRPTGFKMCYRRAK